MSTSYAEKSSVITNYSSTKFRNIVFKVNQILRLLMRGNIVEVNILIAPLKVMNNPLICQLFFDYENVLEEVDDPLLDVKVIEFGDHSLLIL
jgi:hypothetical protein